MGRPSIKVRCECGRKVRVVDHIWNTKEQNFDYKLARHQHTSPDRIYRRSEPILDDEGTEFLGAPRKQNWMSRFGLGRR